MRLRPHEVTKKDLAHVFRCSIREMEEHFENAELLFKASRNERVGKKHRQLDVPTWAAKKKLRRLHRWIQYNQFFHPAAHGSIKGRSTFTCRRKHQMQNHVWKRDIQDCFPSVNPELFKTKMLEIGFSSEISAFLTKICTIRNRLPQGSPLSNDALNLFMLPLDIKLSQRAANCNLVYTRITDDFTISGESKSVGEVFCKDLEAELANLSLKVNEKKRKEAGYLGRNTEQVIHGLKANSKRGTTVSEAYRKKSIELANSYLASCNCVNISTLLSVGLKRRRLVGTIEYIKQADFGPLKHLHDRLNKGDQKVFSKLKNIGLVKKTVKSLSAQPAHKRWYFISQKINNPAWFAEKWSDLTSGAAVSNS